MCVYNQSSDACVIIHEATAVLDVCHKPNIHTSLDPSFPHCKQSSDVVDVDVKCEIGNTTEVYTVTWERDSDTKIHPSKNFVFHLLVVYLNLKETPVTL